MSQSRGLQGDGRGLDRVKVVVMVLSTSGAPELCVREDDAAERRTRKDEKKEL